MPVKVEKRGNKYRVVEVKTGKIATTPNGNARDGGGHASKGKAAAQARIINAHVAKKGAEEEE